MSANEKEHDHAGRGSPRRLTRGGWSAPVFDDETGDVGGGVEYAAKYVVSSTLSDPKWAETTVLVRELKAKIPRMGKSIDRGN